MSKTLEGAENLIAERLTNTLIPFFSWWIRRACWAIFGCKLTIIIRHPTKAYIQAIMETWGKDESLSGEGLYSLEKASERRRYRKRLKKLLVPFFRALRTSEEAITFRRIFQEKLNQLAKSTNSTQPEIPDKVVVVYDIAKQDERMDKEFSDYTDQDFLDTFPIDQTIHPRLIERVIHEVSDYPQTVRSLYWEIPRNWNLIREVKTNKNSKIWALLGIDPNNEPDMEWLINWSLSFALGEVNTNKQLGLARWLMGRMIISSFVEQPFSEKQIISIDTPIDENRGLADLISDSTALTRITRIDDLADLSSALELLPASQREDSLFFIQASNLGKDADDLRRELGNKQYEAKQRNFERALKNLKYLRESGKLPK